MEEAAVNVADSGAETVCDGDIVCVANIDTVEVSDSLTVTEEVRKADSVAVIEGDKRVDIETRGDRDCVDSIVIDVAPD